MFDFKLAALNRAYISYNFHAFLLMVYLFGVGIFEFYKYFCKKLVFW